jgi:hypothetical protein
MARLLAICGSGPFWERSLAQFILSDANPSIGWSTSGLRPPPATLLETQRPCPGRQAQSCPKS